MGNGPAMRVPLLTFEDAMVEMKQKAVSKKFLVSDDSRVQNYWQS